MKYEVHALIEVSLALLSNTALSPLRSSSAQCVSLLSLLTHPLNLSPPLTLTHHTHSLSFHLAPTPLHNISVTNNNLSSLSYTHSLRPSQLTTPQPSLTPLPHHTTFLLLSSISLFVCSCSRSPPRFISFLASVPAFSLLYISIFLAPWKCIFYTIGCFEKRRKEIQRTEIFRAARREGDCLPTLLLSLRSSFVNSLPAHLALCK